MHHQAMEMLPAPCRESNARSHQIIHAVYAGLIPLFANAKQIMPGMMKRKTGSQF